MNPRTRNLIILAGSVATLFLGDKGYRDFVEKPSQERQGRIEKLQKETVAVKDLITTAGHAKLKMATFEEASLPRDSELARSSYQDWLLSLMEQTDFQQITVDPGMPISVTAASRLKKNEKREIAKRYPFSVRGRGSLQQLTQLFYKFYTSPHLHKIRSVSLAPSADGQVLDVALTIEALGLAGCPRKGELADGASNRLAEKSEQDYRVIAQRNLFSADGASALGDVVLTAVTFDKSGQPRAWFSWPQEEQTKVVSCGDRMVVAAHQIEVLDIQPQRVVIELDGQAVSLALGASVQEGVSVVSVAG